MKPQSDSASGDSAASGKAVKSGKGAASGGSPGGAVGGATGDSAESGKKGGLKAGLSAGGTVPAAKSPKVREGAPVTTKILKKKVKGQKPAPVAGLLREVDPSTVPARVAPPQPNEEDAQRILGARRRSQTPSHFKPVRKGNTPIVFTMEDVSEILQKRRPEQNGQENTSTAKKAALEASPVIPVRKSNHSVASLADILGYDPTVQKEKPQERKGTVRPEWQAYYNSLLDLRNHLRQGLSQHASETLRRSAKDDSGDLSGYGQHMADAGTDAFDRDFALSLVSSEQDALNEIEDAISRIFDGSYGVCEITGEVIAPERLEAVPFTRYSLDGQKQLESTRRMQKQRGGLFSDVDEDTPVMGEDDDS